MGLSHEDREMPFTSLDEAAQAPEVIFAAGRPAQLGRPVRLP
ncbi:MAG: hypothetical protein ABSF95_11685 [Verrucomicrobiota bacterium]|jgi:hypothetical protein